MDKETLKKLLLSLDGVSETKGRYEFSENMDIVVHLGELGQGLEVARVKSIAFSDTALDIESADAGRVFAEDSQVCAVVVKSTDFKKASRTGFSL
ncbi:MAG: hypothetical protein IPJ88_11820 [Myxococcales bacterium]|nr:MAG: hypothetical protein IPJ88_11820 [Myxococcales bacterium]